MQCYYTSGTKLVSFTGREWVQVAILPANITEYRVNASNGMIYAGFRILAFNQYGMSEATEFEG